MPLTFSANLGFLWNNLSLPDAIRAARRAGFDAVECHWPYETPAEDVRGALSETALAMLGLNTSPGELTAGEFGLAALPGRETDARAAIDQAIDYATVIGARNVHVTAGFASGDAATSVFLANLDHTCRAAAIRGITILIEPLNPHDAPGYFLRTTDQAVSLMERVGASNLKLMFDCYHVQRTEGDLTHRLKTLLPRIGHIQFASVPDRGPPDRGEIDYGSVFRIIEELGYKEPLGAEYRPGLDTGATLAWLSHFRTR